MPTLEDVIDLVINKYCCHSEKKITRVGSILDGFDHFIAKSQTQMKCIQNTVRFCEINHSLKQIGSNSMIFFYFCFVCGFMFSCCLLNYCRLTFLHQIHFLFAFVTFLLHCSILASIQFLCAHLKVRHAGFIP